MQSREKSAKKDGSEPEDLVPKKMHQSKRLVSVNVWSDYNILISKSFVIPPGSVVTTFQSLGT